MMQRGTIERGAAAGWRTTRLVPLAAVLAIAAGLAACGTISEKMAGPLSDMPAIGLPEGAPERPAEQFAYPAVHDMPPPRAAAVLSDLEQQRMEDDLVAARKAQQSAVAEPKDTQKKPARSKPPAAPVSSSRTTY